MNNRPRTGLAPGLDREVVEKLLEQMQHGWTGTAHTVGGAKTSFLCVKAGGKRAAFTVYARRDLGRCRQQGPDLKQAKG